VEDVGAPLIVAVALEVPKVAPPPGRVSVMVKVLLA